MKTLQPMIGPDQVTLPAEMPRNSVKDRRSAAHRSDPMKHWQHPAPDFRVRAEANLAPQRVRARRNEPRTAVDCHVQFSRRPSTPAD